MNLEDENLEGSDTEDEDFVPGGEPNGLYNYYSVQKCRNVYIT